MHFLTSLTAVLLCFFLASAYPGTDVATVFSVVSMGFTSLLIFKDLQALVSIIQYLLGLDPNDSEIRYAMSMSQSPRTRVSLMLLVLGVTLSAEMWMLVKLYGMI